ncbi:MAG: hypothetical protein J6R12_03225 [Bacteroidales bacterium]|nr:hypothetical protein [Bacteroidales bacterium]
MHITGFLFSGILFLILLCLFAVVERTNFFQYRSRNYNLLNTKEPKGLLIRGVYILLFAVMAFAAVSTMKSYIYPTDESVYKNVDYHVLSHKGYEVGEDFYLASGYTSKSDGYPAKSLWDGKEGEVLIDRADSCFRITEFVEPFYVRKDTENPKWMFWKDSVTRVYKLVNQIIKTDVSNGFNLTLNGDTIYKMEITLDDKKNFMYISTMYENGKSCITDTSTFKKNITQGYPLLDIIAKSPKIEVTDELANLFDGTMLVRTEIPMVGNVPAKFDKKTPPPLCIMPDLSFYVNEDFRINGESYDFKQDFNIPFNEYAYNDKVTFFSGIGNKKSEEFRLSYLPEKRMRLEFLKPDMKQITDTLGRVFINSSIEDVAKESLSGGYLYNKFKEEKNHNHINAHFMYAVGDARSELSINVVDLNSTESEDSIKAYKCDSEFLLSTRDKTSNSISWIFEVSNLRETNDLTANMITLFIVVMLAMVTLRILLDSLLNRNTLSLTELAIYVILLSLCVVRLILGWRSSTFVPVENITLPMYIKMRTSIMEWVTWLAAFMPLLVAIAVELWNLCEGNGAWFRTCLEKFFSKSWNTFIVFFAMLVLCLVLRHISTLNRLCNISFPMIAYFVFEIWMNRLKENSVAGTTLCRILAFFLLFVYLFKADAGFTIIFLAYMMIHYLVLEGLFKYAGNRKLHGISTYKGYILSLFSVIALFFILYFEGDIMIGLFKYAGLVMSVVTGLLLVVVCYFLYCNRVWVNVKGKKSYNVILRSTISLLVAAAFVLSLLDALKVMPSITPLLNEKEHMRYRAEIQRLSGDKKIDHLIMECEFDSDDIEFIMRSAHNQWFINQYIRAGKKMEENDEYFHIQPHSNQGATFTTQTTDLVVTRYLLAEHGERPVRYIMFMWMMLVLLFVLEFRMKERLNRMFLGSPVLIYIISMMVYLSATNRIVFVGQDFPLISLQSRVAILFPLLLFALLLGRCIYVRNNDNNKDSGDTAEYILNGTVFAVFLILFTFGCMGCIEQKGKDQEDTQFNVSRLISELSTKVDEINQRFETFQANKERELRNKGVKDVWDLFVGEESNAYNYVYYNYLSKDDFFASLLKYFDEQTTKTDANQLLHLRRRNGVCHLALNKQHYFIPAIMREEHRWSGDIYASKVDPEMMLFENSKKAINVDNNLSFDNNVLSNSIIDKVPDMPLMHFGKEWTPGDNPLFLISSEQGHSFKAFFEIEADTLKIEGSQKNQIATAVLPGDVLSLYKKSSESKKTQVLMNGKMTNDGTPYIVRNMWLNGHKQLFYPLGKESMWTYHLGNMVSDVYSKAPEYKDTTLYLSLDYELCKSLHASVIKQVKDRITAPKSMAVMDVLTKFNTRPYQQQCNSQNDFYYNEKENKLIVKSNRTNAAHKTAAELVNKELKKNEYRENPLSYSLSKVIQTQFDFTAVAIDGDGQIRALFDYSRKRHLDPNNAAHLNKVISDLYRDGSNADERDIFGSKALQYIPSGPGSSFKPIAYTAITSQRRLAWETINVQQTGQSEAYSDIDLTESGTRPYEWYGGLHLKKGEELNIAGNCVAHSGYLVWSNNLHHSVIIMLGMQESGSATDILRDYNSGIRKEEAFPVFTYQGGYKCFDPEVWYNEKSLVKDNDMLTDGLYDNYHISASAPHLSKSYTRLFGNNKLMSDLYEKGGSSRGWVFPERASLNNADRREKSLRGFNQALLGADPLLMTPLQMAINTSRLASLNSSENIVSLIDGKTVGEYDFFKVGDGWSQADYLRFMKENVWKQLRQVPKQGTASGLKGLASDMENGKYGKPYYLYCKTGTLEDPTLGSKKTDRIKHLLVIITDRPLENVVDVEALKEVRYYALYLSYFGIEDSKRNPFNTINFKPYIVDVLKSNSFKNYMTKQ